jgi:hypothetical protein
MVVSVNRLVMHEGEDYTVSVVGGVTRMSFAGAMLPAGEQALSAGDKIRVAYLKDVR